MRSLECVFIDIIIIMLKLHMMEDDPKRAKTKSESMETWQRRVIEGNCNDIDEHSKRLSSLNHKVQNLKEMKWKEELQAMGEQVESLRDIRKEELEAMEEQIKGLRNMIGEQEEIFKQRIREEKIQRRINRENLLILFESAKVELRKEIGIQLRAEIQQRETIEVQGQAPSTSNNVTAMSDGINK